MADKVTDVSGGIFRDTNPSAPDSERYKLIHRTSGWNRSGEAMDGTEDEPDALVLRENLCAQGYST